MVNLDIIYDYFQYRVTSKDSLNLVIMSDHGVVRSLWESELSNHGVQEDGNESFLFIYDKNCQKSRNPLPWGNTDNLHAKFDEMFHSDENKETEKEINVNDANSLYENNKTILDKIEKIDSFQVVSTIGQLLYYFNIPINSTGLSKKLTSQNWFQLKRLRMHEMQVYEFIKSLPSNEKNESKK
jgi:hypothetical protein